MKRWIDEKGRVFGKINVIDFGILLLVILVAIGAFVKFALLEQTAIATEEIPVRYTLQITSVRHWTVGNLQVGDTLFTSGTDVGTIVSIEAEPHEGLVSTGGGELWWGVVPERYVVFLEVEAIAILSEDRILISRTVPMVSGNALTSFQTKFTEFNATIREIYLHGQ